MPTGDGKLTTEEQQRAINWLKQKAPNMRCAACGNPHFGVAEHLLSPPIYHGGSMVLGGPSYPVFVAACHNCGNMMQFSAVAAGLIGKAGSSENG